MKTLPDLTPSIHRRIKLRSNSGVKSGFALIATISVMVLLVMIALAMLSLSTIELRSSQNGKAMAEAQANARMALMIAIGELQKELGPDKRISARAEILDATPETEEVDDVVNPHYLGVWDSWDTWLTDQKESLSIQDTYQRGRDPSLFRRWLVSHPDSEDYQTAISAAVTEDMVVLCEDHSETPDPTKQVKASRVQVRKDNRVTGNYAWWVSDESQKARLDLQPRDDADTIETAQIASSHTGRLGIEKMTGMSDFDTTPENLDKMISIGQAQISAPAAAKHFHDLTAYSLGLLTDVRSGGFKRDLNLAFESDDVPEEMDETELFGGRPYDAPIRPMNGELADIEPQNPYVAPMSWRQMREYYRVYRNFPDSEDMHPITWEGGKPVTERFLMGKTGYEWDTKGYTRQLVTLRQTWILATSSEANPQSPGGVDYYILAVPVLHLWNPNNITMKVDSKEISSLGAMFWSVAMRQKVYRGSNLVGEYNFPRTGYEGENAAGHKLTANQYGYRMIPTEAGSSSVIEFQPGEVRVFSTDAHIEVGNGAGAHDQRSFFASPGYTPVEDTGVLRGLKYQVNPGSGSGPLSFSLRLSQFIDRATQGHNDNSYFGAPESSALIYSFQEVSTATKGVYYEDGSLVTPTEWHPVSRLSATSVDWVQPSELGNAWIVKDDAASRVEWGAPGTSPMPVGIFSIVAKSAEQLEFDSSADFAKDFRNRSWLHAPPTGLGSYLFNPVDLNRADSPYQLHFRPVNGDQEVAQYMQATGRSGYFGKAYSAEGQTHLAPLNLPTAPAMNLGSFAGLRMTNARAQIIQANDSNSNPSVDKSKLVGFQGSVHYTFKHVAHRGGAFGAGIGNAYAHPMIEQDRVYTRNSFGDDPGEWRDGIGSTSMGVCDDYWDHLFLANEELWDSWFCSGIAPAMNKGNIVTSKEEVAENFFSHETTQLSQHFRPNLRGKTAEEIATIAETTSGTPGQRGWDVIASYLFNKGQFNVNSTSKEAWKALILSLADRPIAINEPESGSSVRARDPEEVTLSRHPLANSETAATGPDDENAWRGIRTLTENQVDKLAEQIVRQVKERGPFLNMTEFINRRLTDDATGVTGALQAAIDWDEFDAGYNGTTSGSGEVINKDYKGSDAMISTGDLPATYPNPKAATGSRYAGIPGYVMQSDLLQGIGGSLSVRGDTFLIRTYGESLTSNGKVAAAAWCEAVVQRVPEYVDPTDEADKKLRVADQLPNDTPDLQPLNNTFGRRFNIISFRWLNKDEI